MDRNGREKWLLQWDLAAGASSVPSQGSGKQPALQGDPPS